MDFSKLVKERYSLRNFDSRPIEQEKLDMILEAGRLAPTACNYQPQRIIVISNEEDIMKLRECTNYCFNAPMFLLVCYDKTVSWVRSFDGKNSGDIDASIVATHLMMQAAELGLGTTWVGYFDPELISKNLALGEDIVPVALLPIGYPADGAIASPLHEKRNSMKESVFIK